MVQHRWNVDLIHNGAAQTGMDDEPWDRTPVSTFIGWERDRRAERMKPLSPSFYRNPYARDVWYHMIEIIFRCQRYRPGLIAAFKPGNTSDTEFKVAIACVTWQIYDTHPLPDDLIPTVTNYTRSILGGHSNTVIPPGDRRISAYILDTFFMLNAIWDLVDVNPTLEPAISSLLRLFSRLRIHAEEVVNSPSQQPSLITQGERGGEVYALLQYE